MPAQAYVEVAFSLLADCILDEKEEYFARGGKMVIASAMIYKFWFRQTGSAVAHRLALKHLNHYGADDDTKKFTKVLAAHQESLIQSCEGEEAVIGYKPLSPSKKKPGKS